LTEYEPVWWLKQELVRFVRRTKINRRDKKVPKHCFISGCAVPFANWKFAERYKFGFGLRLI
jgi:hypothetical protein